MNAMKRFLPFFRPYARHGAAIAAVLLGTTLITVGTPYFYKELVDDGIERGDAAYVVAMLAAILAAMAAQELLYLAQKHLTLDVREKVFARLRMDLIAHLLRLPQSYYAQSHKGRLLSRLTSDVDAVQNLLLEKYIYFAQNVLVGLSIFIVIGMLNAAMIFVAGLFLPLLGLLFLAFRRRIAESGKEAQEKQETMVERLQEDLSMVKAIQAFSVLRPRLERTNASIGEAARAKRLLGLRYAWASSATALLNMLGVAVIWGIGGVAVIEGRMSLGTLIAISFYLNYVVHLFFNAYHTLIGFQASLPAAKRIFEVLDASPSTEAPGAKPVGKLTEGIVFRDVAFSYGNGKPVFENVSFRLRKGELIGVVGDSGKGKTTLVNLLMRFYDPDAGAIEWDGMDLREATLDSLRRAVASVPQEDPMFSATVRENIVLGRTGADEAKFLEACRAAGVDGFATALERGYDTEIGENGMKLSSGQRKRLSIARALLEDPDVLVFDEATSVLDERTERDIMEVAKELARTRLVLVVTHKLSNVSDASRLLHVHAGTVTVYESYDAYRKKVLLA